jgi:hypothetical protein
MASLATEPTFMRISGDNDVLVDRLKRPLQRALEGRNTAYSVRIEAVGRVGEVMVCITGSKGRLPLRFGYEELEPGYVSTVVHGVMNRFAL